MRKPILFAWCLFILNCGVAVIPSGGQDLSGSIYQQGVQLYQKKDYAGAVDYLGQVCDMVDTHHEARYYLIYSLSALGRYRQALIHAETLVQQKPDEPRYQKALAQIQEVMERSRKPVPSKPPESTSLVTRMPRMTGYRSAVMPGQASGTVSRPPSSEKPRPPISEKPLTPFDQAIQALDLQEYATAAVLLDELMKKEKTNAKVFHFRGVVEFQQGKYDEARRFFESALKIAPESYDTLFLNGEALLKDAKFELAEKAFEKALKVKDDAYARINLAETKRALGKLDEAIPLLKEVLAKNDTIQEARIYLTEAYIEKNDLEAASAEINQVLSKDPQNGLARFVRAKVLFQGGLYEDAELSVRQALVISPENRLFQTFHAQVLLKMNRVNEAVDTAGKVINEEADNWEARLVLAQAFFQGGDAQTAQEHLAHVSQIVSSPEITLLEARIARKLGDNDRAQALFQTYFSQDQSSPQVYLEYAELLTALGDSDSALDMLNQVKERFPGTPFAVAAEGKIVAAEGASGRKKTPGSPPVEPKPTPPPAGQSGFNRDRVEY
jgi:tetratricopeptide (TPR) repeat protein